MPLVKILVLSDATTEVVAKLREDLKSNKPIVILGAASTLSVDTEKDLISTLGGSVVTLLEEIEKAIADLSYLVIVDSPVQAIMVR